MLPLEPLRLIGIQLSDMIKQSEFQSNSIENFFKKIQ
jgi:hypothetical protein